MYTTHEPLTINSHIASPPVLLQDILLESKLRDGLLLVDRTGYSTSDVMYIAEQMDIVGQSGYVDRKECTSSYSQSMPALPRAR